MNHPQHTAVAALVLGHPEASRTDELDALDTPAVVEVILERHHEYLRRTLPVLEHLSAKVARVHSESEPRLVRLATLIAQLRERLEDHLDEEERVLFPLLVAEERSDRVEELLIDMWHEHVDLGSTLAELRELSDGYQPPSWACASYSSLFDELAALDEDVVRQMHLENQVLAPRFHHLASVR